MNTRSIKYIESDEDILDQEVENALRKSMEQRLYEYCQQIKFNYAMAGIDVQTYFDKTNHLFYR